MSKATSRLSLAAISLTIGLVSFILLAVINPWLFSLEMTSLTFRQLQYSPPASHIRENPIELIMFDQKTESSPEFEKLFGAPMSRSAPAYMVRFFKRTQPKKTIFDLSFNGGIRHHDLAGDQDLVDSLQGTDSFVSALVMTNEKDGTFSFASQPPSVQAILAANSIQVRGLEHFPVFGKVSAFNSLVSPYPDLFQKTPMHFWSANESIFHSDQNSAASQDISYDSRRWVAFSIYGNLVFPSLPLGTVIGNHRELTIAPDGMLHWPGGSLNLGADGLPMIKWYGHAYQGRAIYPETSMWDIIQSEIVLECREGSRRPVCKAAWLPKEPLVTPERFKDKYVLLGMGQRSSGDSHRSIYGPYYRGVYILANILDNVLHHDFVYPAPAWLNILAVLLLPLLMIAVIWRFRSFLIGLLMCMALSLGYFLLCKYAYEVWNLWLYVVYPIVSTLICFAGIYIYRYFAEARKREQLRYAFGKYVSPAVMQIIEKNPERVTLGGERREMTFLFSDIRGFTTFSDNNPPEVVQKLLTQYFSAMNGIILHDYHGSINKLIGDAIMAYWGFPLQNEDHAFRAVSAAMAMRDVIRQWQQDPTKPPFNIGVGINTGDAVIGNVGSEDFMDFTVIGDAVNVASRLESANKEFGTNIIISAFTYEKVKDRIRARSLGFTSIRGKETKLELFEPLDFI